MWSTRGLRGSVTTLLGRSKSVRALWITNSAAPTAGENSDEPVRAYRSSASLLHSPSARWHSNHRARWAALVTCAVGSLGIGLYIGQKSRTAYCAEKSKEETEQQASPTAGAPRTDLPTYRKADISKHTSKESGIWVTFNNGVYDITEFLVGHPGGDKILLAAGGGLEPFWQMYAIHKNPEVFEILEELRIGNIHPDDLKEFKVTDSDDPYRNDPDRHPALRVNAAKPFNAEPPPELLVDNFITPNELFFVRNHLPVAKVDVDKFQLSVGSDESLRPINFSLSDLKHEFKEHKVTAAVQCAGNRRSNMRKFKEVKGLDWGYTAISNAEWTGVKLSDVLEYAGLKEDEFKHVLFQGLDKDLEGTPYEASVPAETAFDPRKDVLLAYEMNGQPIPIDHGFPLRVIVPGVVGARQVKWLSKIICSREESKSHWQQNDYKAFNPSTDWHNVDFSKAAAIQEYPIQSAICEPLPESTLPDGEEVTVKGYAWSGGGRGIIRVDVTLDGGKTWHEATLKTASQRRHREWAWTLWEATLLISPDHGGAVEISCKATDTSHNTQPETAESIWNLRGLIHNAWHRVNVHVPSE